MHNKIWNPPNARAAQVSSPGAQMDRAQKVAYQREVNKLWSDLQEAKANIAALEKRAGISHSPPAEREVSLVEKAQPSSDDVPTVSLAMLQDLLNK